MLPDRPKNVIEHTKDFAVFEHEVGNLYELLDEAGPSRIGIFFSGPDARKFKSMLDSPLNPSETLNKRLRKIFNLARRNIDRGHPKL